ncbi:hypothetical protein [Variovorax paradoxus]|uniref:hypothetical protein n=1 Tax=Variovorax paradoxus TaxID=34073 RepID=UPI0027809A29|nr:hypothetical protein [Variovorax paradoxus]MDQ0586602.1 putative transcriptional regulator [Variovorax paradoxus]
MPAVLHDRYSTHRAVQCAWEDDASVYHLLLLDEVDQGLADVQAGRTVDALEGLAELKLKRKARSGGTAG